LEVDEVTTLQRAAKTERDTAGRQTEAETARQTASQRNVLLPAATAINLEAGSGWAVFALETEGRDVSGVRKV
jgi:hypothetical protein